MEADIAGMVSVALVTAFVAAQIFKTLRNNARQKTLREAITRGVTVTPEMLLEAERASEPGANDLRNGMVLIALALAIAGFGLIEGGGSIKEAIGISLFPLFVGIALLLRLRMRSTQGDA